ncbi:MAG TPA: hypothetical protein VHV55_02730 [Pirellulales bacterium]|jgi:Mrp family chromosome partitioning ATPase|nr:hypothetical protein [Pirellulales bacterium]
MGRMLEAIKQIEAKGPPSTAGGMRPTPRRRSGSAPAPAPWPEPMQPEAWPPAAETLDPAELEPLTFVEAALEPLLAETSFIEPPLSAPPTIAPPGMAPPVNVPLKAAPPEFAYRESHVHRPAPTDQVRRVAAAMMAHVSALTSGVVALAAADPGLETTKISAALAEALADGPKHEVLLVDARLERAPGRLAEYWGGAPGLMDVLRRQTTWHETIRPTALRGLSVLEAGTPGDLPSIEQWRLLWSDLKRRFRFILLDGGPATSMSAGWTSTVDAVYLLVELDRTPRWMAEEATRHLQQSGARLAGAVLLDGQMRG